MLNLLLNGGKFNSEREEREPSLSEFTRRQNAFVDTPAGMLPMGWKVIRFSVLRTTEPTSETTLTLNRNLLVKYCGPFPAGDFCERTQFPASYKVSVAVGSQSKGSSIERFLGRNLLSCFYEGKQILQVYAKMQWITVLICQTFHVDIWKSELLYCHYHTALCITDVSALLICPCGQIITA